MGLAGALVVCSCAQPLRASENGGPSSREEPSARNDDQTLPPVVHQRRCGLALGVTAGGVLGAAFGYPNDTIKIDRDPFFTTTGIGGGGLGGGWFGIALTDWFVFGFSGNGGVLRSADHHTLFWAGGFHIDVFAAYALGGHWRDLGVMLEAGLGVSDSKSTAGRVEVESGAASRVALGVFYEGVRLWQLSMGPVVTVDMMFSPAATRPLAFAGWRTAFYGGP